jgi:hypothetical protein
MRRIAKTINQDHCWDGASTLSEALSIDLKRQDCLGLAKYRE